MKTYADKGTLLANPIKEYMAVCANADCDEREIIHNHRRGAVYLFKKGGWRLRKNGWICPRCSGFAEETEKTR